jgi:hypothetical protein
VSVSGLLLKVVSSYTLRLFMRLVCRMEPYRIMFVSRAIHARMLLSVII